MKIVRTVVRGSRPTKRWECDPASGPELCFNWEIRTMGEWAQ